MRVLLIEDDSATAQSIELMLKSEGFNVYTTDLGEEGVDLGKIYDYDLILLDLNLPDMSGMDVLRTLRVGKINTPIMILSGTSEIDTKVKTFSGGADDYMTKPFDFPELAARVRALLRRPTHSRSPLLTVAGVELDPAAHIVRRHGVVVPLTAREFALLHYLMDRAEEVVSRSDLLDAVWDAHYDGLSNVVDVHVANVRRKLELPGQPNPIETVRGVGYRISEVNAS